MKTKNIPNVLSVLRILLVLSLYIIAFYKFQTTVIIVLTVTFLTDFFDGLIARKLKSHSEFGAKLDSTADYLTFLSLPLIFYLARPDLVIQNIVVITSLAGLYVFEYFTALAFQKRFLALHLYSSKLSNVLISIFAVYALIFEFNRIFFSVVFIVTAAAILEDLTIQITYKKTRTNMVSFFYKLNRQKLRKITTAAAINGFVIGFTVYMYVIWISSQMLKPGVMLKYCIVGLIAGYAAGTMLKKTFLRSYSLNLT